MQAQAAELSGYVSESSSFCPFILPPHQDKAAKAGAFAYVPGELRNFFDRSLKWFVLTHLF